MVFANGVRVKVKKTQKEGTVKDGPWKKGKMKEWKIRIDGEDKNRLLKETDMELVIPDIKMED